MKSQVGTEYIVVYGIILLTVVIIGGSLYSLGVFNIGSTIKKAHEGLNGFVVIDWKAEKSNESAILNNVKKITIYNPNNETLTNFQVKMNISYQKYMNPNFSDIRFVDENNDTIPYWIENKVNGKWALVWVRIPYLPANDYATIYMHFGDPNAISESNGSAVFELFDGFDESKLNTNVWYNDGMNISFSNGTVTLESDVTARLFSKKIFNPPVVIESRAVIPPQPDETCTATGMGFISNKTDNDDCYVLTIRPSYGSCGSDWYLLNKTDSHGCNSCCSGLPADNKFHIFRLDITTTQGTLYIDGVKKASIGYSGNSSVGFQVQENSTAEKVDWILVRKYAPEDPTYKISNIESNTLKELIIQLSPSVYSISNVAVKIKYNGLINDCSAPSIMHQGEKYEVKCILPNSGSLKGGDPYRVKVIISYTNSMSGLKHVESGTFSGVIE